MTQWSPRLW